VQALLAGRSSGTRECSTEQQPADIAGVVVSLLLMITGIVITANGAPWPPVSCRPNPMETQ
jgi:hypothetical protein